VIDPSIGPKVPPSDKAVRGRSMLKYASKFFFEKIMPSVVATVAGAYIVNHYVVS
jgi:hypothetical protein